MITVSAEEIQRDWEKYLHQVKSGETIVITEDDQPIAEIKPVASRGVQLRPFALCAGEFEVPEDFDTPLPDEILDLFG